jgi:hypothetical protein
VTQLATRPWKDGPSEQIPFDIASIPFDDRLLLEALELSLVEPLVEPLVEQPESISINAILDLAPSTAVGRGGRHKLM